MEAVGRGRDACLFSVFGLQNAGDGVRGEFSAADIEESSYDIADHFIEEPVPFDMEAVPLKRDRFDGADRIFFLFACQCTEVMGPYEGGGCSFYFCGVKGISKMPRIEAICRILHGGGADPVPVFFADGIQGGVELARDNVQNSDIVW